nr:NAD-dependent epimerase/dehydratase family protein [Actinomycetota bacterium]
MRIGITGASGLIGSALAEHLIQRGDQVVRFVRREAASDSEVTWQPGQPLDPSSLDGLDAVVHLAGAGVGDKRWSDEYKRII